VSIKPAAAQTEWLDKNAPFCGLGTKPSLVTGNPDAEAIPRRMPILGSLKETTTSWVSVLVIAMRVVGAE